MAGGKAAAKASPAKKRVSKASPKAGSSGKKNAYTGTADNKLTLLYMCFKHKEGNVDFKAVGKAYDISPTAAQYRFYRLRDFMEKQDLPGKEKTVADNGGSPDMDVDDDGDHDEDDDQGRNASIKQEDSSSLDQDCEA